MVCGKIQEDYHDDIQEIISIQRKKNREAIFFMYEDGSRSEIIVGEATHIQISSDQKKSIYRRGDVIGSVHTHPAGFDPSSIDIMTAISTDQQYMGVAVPITYDDGTRDYTLSVVDLGDSGFIDQRRLFRGMRRTMVSFTLNGNNVRRELNLQASKAKACRTHEVVKDGAEFPQFDRPSLFDIQAGKELGVVDGDTMWLSSSEV